MNTNTASRVRRIATLLAAGFTAGAAIGFAAGLFEPHLRAAGKPDADAAGRIPELREAAGAQMPPAQNRSVQPPVSGPLDSAGTSRTAVG